MGLLILLKRGAVIRIFVRESVLFKRTHVTKVLPRLLQSWRLVLSFSKATALHHCFHPTISLPVATTHGFFFDLWTIVHLWFLIYHVRPADSFRRKRKFLWRHRSGKIKIKKLASPFSKNHIDLLKATVRGRLYYGGPEYICGTCQVLYWFQERSKGAHDGRFNLPVYNGCYVGKVSLPKFPDWSFPLKDLLRFDDNYM
nr:uncharacterized protein LOC109749279 isoform X2 [Aegilops tauschii subsp. strangulata]